MLKSNLKIKRIQAGLTQFQLAEKLGVKERVITLYETNRARPTIETMVNIARILSADPAEIFPESFVVVKK